MCWGARRKGALIVLSAICSSLRLSRTCGDSHMPVGHSARKKVSQMCSVGSCGVPGTRIPLAGCCRQQSVNLQCVNLTSPHREVNQPGSVPCSSTLLIALKRLQHSVLGPNSSGFSHLFDSYITKSCNLSL